MKLLNYNDVIDKLVHCAYSNRKVDTWEDIIAIINNIPTTDMNYVGEQKVIRHNGDVATHKLYEVIE